MADIATWVAAGIAVLAAGAAFWQSNSAKRSAKAAERSADAAVEQTGLARREAEAAERSAAEAAEQTQLAGRSAEAAERSATASERQAELAGADAESRAVRWDLAWAKGDTFQLSNLGTSTAFGVDVEMSDAYIFEKHFDAPATIDGDGGVLFMATGRMGWDRTVVVTWHRRPDCSDEPATWQKPLPFRPS